MCAHKLLAAKAESDFPDSAVYLHQKLWDCSESFERKLKKVVLRSEHQKKNQKKKPNEQKRLKDAVITLRQEWVVYKSP